MLLGDRRRAIPILERRRPVRRAPELQEAPLKLAYFHLLTADNDDAALGDAKVMGYVPETCLLGGLTAWKAISAGRDPCATCHGPRPRCGGRPEQEDFRPESFAGIFADYRGALAAPAVDPEEEKGADVVKGLTRAR